MAPRPHVIDLPPPSPEETLVHMGRLANEAQADPQLRLLVEDIVREVYPHDYLSEYMAIYHWVQMNVRYTRDPVTVEQLKTPAAVLRTRAADCDCIATLLAAMVGVVGGKSRFVAGAFRAGVLEHVWCEVYEPRSKAWVVLDPVPGRRVQQMLGRVVDSIVAPGVG